MSDEFKSVFLVCIDHNDDTNYVVGRSFSMKKAQKLAKAAEQFWPGREIYLTVEKVPVNNPLKNLEDMNIVPMEMVSNRNPSEICICGKNPGGCIGSLSCKCSAIARCKKVTDENPLDFENFSYQKKLELEPAIVEVVNIKRGIIEVTIPEWDPKEIIGLPPDEISSSLRKILEPGLQLMADVNLNASNVSELVLDNLRYEELEEVEEIEYIEKNPVLEEDSEEFLETEETTSEDSVQDDNKVE